MQEATASQQSTAPAPAQAVAPATAQATAPTPTATPTPKAAPAPANTVVTDKLIAERDEALAKLAEIESAKEQAERQKAIEQGDLKKLLDADKEKFTAELQARDEQIRTYQQTIANQQRDKLIKECAAELMTSEWQFVGELMLKDRIGVTLDKTGQPQTIIYDADKKKSALSLDKLKEEFRADKRIEKLLLGNKVGSGTTNAAGMDQQVPAGKDSKESILASLGSDISNEDKINNYMAYKRAGPTQLVEFAKRRKA